MPQFRRAFTGFFFRLILVILISAHVPFAFGSQGDQPNISHLKVLSTLHDVGSLSALLRGSLDNERFRAFQEYLNRNRLGANTKWPEMAIKGNQIHVTGSDAPLIIESTSPLTMKFKKSVWVYDKKKDFAANLQTLETMFKQYKTVQLKGGSVLGLGLPVAYAATNSLAGNLTLVGGGVVVGTIGPVGFALGLSMIGYAIADTFGAFDPTQPEVLPRPPKCPSKDDPKLTLTFDTSKGPLEMKIESEKGWLKKVTAYRNGKEIRSLIYDPNAISPTRPVAIQEPGKPLKKIINNREFESYELPEVQFDREAPLSVNTLQYFVRVCNEPENLEAVNKSIEEMRKKVATGEIRFGRAIAGAAPSGSDGSNPTSGTK